MSPLEKFIVWAI